MDGDEDTVLEYVVDSGEDTGMGDVVDGGKDTVGKEVLLFLCLTMTVQLSLGMNYYAVLWAFCHQGPLRPEQ